MPYIPFTEEQKLRANNVNLVEFLRRQGEKLIPSGRDKRLSSDHSITVRGNEWYDHESKEGGRAISFVQTYYGLTYQEAVKRLLDGEGVAYPQTVPSEPEKPKEFSLPPASPTMRQLYAYLLQQRFIDRDVLDAFTKRGMIYESCEKSRDGTKEYHRDYFEPYSVYFTLVSDGDKKYIVSDEIPFAPDNHEKLVNTVNMVLATFGECTVDFTEQENTMKRVVVNWDILPRGEYPWSSIKETLGSLAKEHTKTQTELMLRNCESIYARKPDFVAYGRAGFRGYAVFGFTSKNLYVLESAIPNNATYILQNDWETISQLSKAEILSQDLHKARIVHSKNWKKNFDAIMEGKNG